MANIVQRATAGLQPKGGGITNVGECRRAEDANSRKVRQPGAPDIRRSNGDTRDFTGRSVRLASQVL